MNLNNVAGVKSLLRCTKPPKTDHGFKIGPTMWSKNQFVISFKNVPLFTCFMTVSEWFGSQTVILLVYSFKTMTAVSCLFSAGAVIKFPAIPPLSQEETCSRIRTWLSRSGHLPRLTEGLRRQSGDTKGNETVPGVLSMWKKRQKSMVVVATLVASTWRKIHLIRQTLSQF